MNRFYLVLSIIIPLTAILSISIYDGISSSDNLFNKAVVTNEGLGVGAGHFTVTVKDSMGVTQAFRQTDNLIMNSGENCIAKMIFGDSVDAGTGVCAGTTDDPWNTFCLDENPAMDNQDTDMRTAATSAGLTCALAGRTWNQNSTGDTDTLSKVTLKLSKTFTNTGAAENIAAVGVFNSTVVSTNNFLSKANFTLTNVPNLGTITINYDYEVGGGTVPP